jgi:serine O-acetyltransferase
MLKQLKYLMYDFDRWAFAIKIPFIFSWVVLFLYPAAWVVFLYRVGRALDSIKFRPLKIVLLLPFQLIKRFLDALLGAEISIKADIGQGFYIAHLGGIVIGMGTKAGENFSIRQGVTFGGSGKKGMNHPVVGDNVLIGAGAVVIGAVCIGNNVVVGANSVVIKNIDDECRVAGIPAKPINYNGVMGISVRKDRKINE